jgi:hypothetical protein
MILYFISLTVFAVYIIYIMAKFGIPASISDSFYLLKGKGWMFTIWCYAVAFTVAAMMFTQSKDCWYQFLGLFAGGGLAFVGTAPLFKGHERTVHYVSAGMCAVAALGWMVAAGYRYIPMSFLLASGAATLRFGRPVFWVEIACFASMYVVLCCKLLGG